ncbi:MAG: phosphagen kinase [Desulfotalea sp.]
MYNKIFPADSRCLAKKYLTDDLFVNLRGQKTASGFTINKAIKSGVENVDSSIGIYAGDVESYQTFSAIFDHVISDYHRLQDGCSQSKIENFSKVELEILDPENKYIKSTRVRVARSVNGFNFTNNIDLAERRLLEKKVLSSLGYLGDKFAGEYRSFQNLNETEIGSIARAGLFFSKGDRFQESAGFNVDYPACRGIFASHDRRLRIWLNEEDHLRVISQAADSNLSAVFNHLVDALGELDTNLSFVKNERYGYLTSCPTNIGTSMRAGVHIQLRKLDSNRPLLDSIIERNDLQLRGTSGEKTDVQDAIFDISNRRRLGISEVQIITNLHKGLQEIIAAEENL